MKAPREFPKPTFFGKKLEMTNILFFSKITLVCNYNGGRRAEIDLNILSSLRGMFITGSWPRNGGPVVRPNYASPKYLFLFSIKPLYT